ncbi:MAG: undecaprenyl/decaprenyl-phosphate alpha-N-acetylglucosaminyl 1-phosphate transferase [Tenericutes bacterium]|nr:undecaprenyl/decaprenyl-phosphate alpha-N-acetylglucosaminyl 1-phosphate transferase [Mycoplasmatota bacterium]
MFNSDIGLSLKMILVTFLASVCIMPIMKKVAHHIGAIDIPRKDEGNRHIHKKPIPKLGGVGIFLAFLFGYMLFGQHSIKMNAILIGSFIIILTGIVDDINDLRASRQLIAQLLAAGIIVFYGGISLTEVTAFSLHINFGIFSDLITIFFIVACINIINFTDGLDGLSGGVTSIFYITTAIICFYQGRLGSLEMTLTLLMLGSTLGFLVHNFYPAKIFAGQCSMFMGFMISIICLLGFKGTALTSLFVPIAILGLPILDTLFAIIRRMLKGQPIFSADRCHFHHQLLGMNFSQRTTVIIIYFINILFALTSIFYVLKDQVAAKIIYIILTVIVVWFVCYTNIITEKTPPKLKDIKKKINNRKKK